jgi:hypothetical protein
MKSAISRAACGCAGCADTGVALLVGSIVPLDLRLLGAWCWVPLAPLGGVLSRIAGTGLVLAMIFGTLLFITRASEYIASNLFISKMVVVAVGTANALALRMMWSAQVSEITSTNGKTPERLRLTAGISLATWLAALTLGRSSATFKPGCSFPAEAVSQLSFRAPSPFLRINSGEKSFFRT